MISCATWYLSRSARAITTLAEEVVQHRCESCGFPSDAKCKVTLSSLGSHVMFMLKRYTTTSQGQVVKLDTCVHMPSSLMFAHKAMRLHGIVEHIGTSASAGHYVTYVRESSGFCRYDDAHVSRSLHLPMSITRSAYLLLYKECPMTAHAPQQQSNFPTAEQNDIIFAKLDQGFCSGANQGPSCCESEKDVAQAEQKHALPLAQGTCSLHQTLHASC